MSVFLKTLKVITKALMYVSYAATLAMMVIVVWDVIMRYVFNKPSSGVTEISQMLLIISMTAMANALIEKRYVAVGSLVDRFPKGLNIAFEILMGVLSIIFFFIVGYNLIVMAEGAFRTHETYFVLKTPRWPMYGVLGVSFLACVLATIGYVIEKIQTFSTEEKSVFDDNPDLAILAFADEDAKGGNE